MSWTRVLIFTLAAVGASVSPASLLALEFRSINQWPRMVKQDAGKVIIANISAAALSISYLQEGWKSVQIPSGQYVPLPSPADCLSISFHDGIEAQSATLNPGTIYAMYLSSTPTRW